MVRRWSPEEAMRDVLERHLEADRAEACFDSLEGTDYDDLDTIKDKIGVYVADIKTLDEIMREYWTWLLNSKTD